MDAALLAGSRKAGDGAGEGAGADHSGPVCPSGALSSNLPPRSFQQGSNEKYTPGAESRAWCPAAGPGGFSLTASPSTTPSTSAHISAGRSLWPQSCCAHSQGRSPAPRSPHQQLPGVGMKGPAPLALGPDNSEVQDFLHCQTGFPRDGDPVSCAWRQPVPSGTLADLLLFHPHFPPPPGFSGVTSQMDAT